MDYRSEKILYCSFCGKSQHEVRKLISGENVFKIIWPESGFLEGKHDENDASLVVKFENGTFSSLFAGDISSKAETFHN